MFERVECVWRRAGAANQRLSTTGIGLRRRLALEPALRALIARLG